MWYVVPFSNDHSVKEYLSVGLVGRWFGPSIKGKLDS